MGYIPPLNMTFPSMEDVLNKQATALAAPPPAQQGTGFFGSALSAGGRGLLASTARGVGTAANFVGATGVGQAANDYADQQRALQLQNQNPAYENAPWYSPTGLAYKTLEGLPSMVGAGLGAVAGGALASVVAPEALVGAGVAGAVGLGARALGGAAALYPSAVGDAAQRAIDEGQPENDGKALAYGAPLALVQGAFPAFAEAKIAGGAASKALSGLGMGAEGSIKRAAVTGFGINAAAGAAGEALMQQMGDPDRAFASRAQDILNAGLMGGVQGGVIGGVVHSFVKTPPGEVTNEDMTNALDGVNLTGRAPTTTPGKLDPNRQAPGPDNGGYEGQSANVPSALGNLDRPQVIQPPGYVPTQRRSVGIGPRLPTVFDPGMGESANVPLALGDLKPAQVIQPPNSAEVNIPPEGVTAGVPETPRNPYSANVPQYVEPLQRRAGVNEMPPGGARAQVPPAPPNQPGILTGQVPPEGRVVSPSRVIDNTQPGDKNTSGLPRTAATDNLDPNIANRANVPPAGPKLLPPPEERPNRPVSGEPVITPPPAEEQGLKAAFNKDLIAIVDRFGPDSIDGKGAWEELQRRIPEGTPKGGVQAALDAQDAQRTTDLTGQANRAILDGIDTPQRMGAFNHKKMDPALLGNTDALRAHIYDTAVARDKSGTLSPNMLKVARSFDLFDEHGRLVDPRPQTEVDPGTPDAAALANEPQDDVPNRAGVPEGSPYADEHAAMDGIRRNLPDSLDPETRSSLLSKLDTAQGIMSAEAPGKGQISKARALAKSVQAAVDAQKVIDKAAGRETTSTKAPVVDTTKGATKFDVPPDPVNRKPSEPVLNSAPPAPVEPQPNKALTKGLVGPLKAMKSTLDSLVRPKDDVNKPTKKQKSFDKDLASLQEQHAKLTEMVKNGDTAGIAKVKDNFFGDDLYANHGEGNDAAQNAKIEKVNDHINNVLDAVNEINGKKGLNAREQTPYASRTVSDRDLDLTRHIADGKSLRDILKDIVANGSTSLRKTIAARLLETKIDPTLRFGTTAEMEDAHPNTVFGDYHAPFDRIRIFDQADLEHTILHEATHAATLKGLQDPAFRAKVQGLMDAASRLMTPDERAHQSMSSPEEFLAEAQSNSQFQHFLGSLKGDGTKLSIWDNIKNAVREFFGFPKGSESLLDQTLSATGEAMDKTDAMQAQSPVGLNDVTKLYARTVQENAQKAWEYVNASDKYTKAFARMLQWRTLPDIMRGARDVIASAMKLIDDTKRRDISENRLNAPNLVAALGKYKLDAKATERTHFLLTGSAMRLDPRISFAAHTWLKDVEPAQAKILADYHKRLFDTYNELGKTGANKVYDTYVAANQVQNMGRIMGTLHATATLPEFADRLNVSLDPDKLYREDKTGLHQNPAQAAEFMKGLAKGLLGKVTDAVGKYDADIKAAIDPKEIERLKEERDTLADAADMAKRNLAEADQEPNFSQRRSGSYFVAAKMPPNFNDTHIKAVRDALDAAGFRDAVVEQGIENRAIYVRTNSDDKNDRLAAAFRDLQKKGILADGEGNAVTNGSSKQIVDNPGLMPKHIKALMSRIQNKFPPIPEGSDPVQSAAIRAAREQAINQMQDQLLDLLPDSSRAKIWTRRENVQGFVSDLKGQDQRLQNSARAVANLFHGDTMHATLSQMGREVEATNARGDLSTAQKARAAAAVGEAYLRNAQQRVYVPQGGLDDVRHWTHMLEMSISPVYTAALMTQNFTLGLPELAKTHGYAESAKAILANQGKSFQVLQKAFGSKLFGKDADPTRWEFIMNAAKLAGMSAKDIDFLLTQDNMGTFDLAGYTHAMFEDMHHKSPVVQQMFELSEAWSRYSEMQPRLAMAFAARDMYEKRPPAPTKDFHDMHSFVAHMVNSSQLDWSPSMGPRATSKHGAVGPLGPLVSQLQGYRIRLTEKLAREFNDAMGARGPEYQRQGRRFLAGHLAMGAAAFGTMGLPGVNFVAGAYDRLADLFTGDNTHDIRASYRQGLSNIFGDEMGEALAHGVPRFAGLDMSKSGEDRLLPLTDLMASKQKWEDAMSDWAKRSLGPAFGDVTDAVLAARDVYDGDYLEAATKFGPEVTRRMAEGYKLGTRGYTDKAGFKFGDDPSAFEIAQKVAGFTPPAEANYEEKNKIGEGQTERYRYDTQNVLTHLARAQNMGDREEFNKWSAVSAQLGRNHPGELPPLAQFADYMKTHATGAAISRSTGLPLGVRINDLGTRERLNYGNMNQ